MSDIENFLHARGEQRIKLTLLNMLHGEVLMADESAEAMIRHLDPAEEEDRAVYEALTKLRVAIGPYIDGLAELEVYGRSKG